mmetsp:Transcript_7311/g.21216  ORF Transcript_7311/g.21216 Transcript_7311/m.21216 type:complete len:627 (+) Transcript_7311:269-2149(+)
MASGSVVTQMESVLSTTLTDLHIRNEVGGCIQDMLLDIETTHHLQQQLELDSTQKLLEKVQTEQQAVILEAHAERMERYERRIDVADRFLVELLQVNREMKGLLAWKEAHEYKVRNYDAVLAQLAQTEEELKEANRVCYGSESRPRRAEDAKSPPKETKQETATESSSSAAAETAADKTVSAAESIPEQTPEKTVGSTSSEAALATASETMIAEKTEPDNSEAASSAPISDQKTTAETEQGQDDDASPAEEDEKLPATETAVVSIDTEADSKEDIPTLMTLDVELLMNVFGFLDAMDILNTAQINVTMYNKVDNIFGISEDGQSPPVPTPPPPPPPPPKSKTAASSSSAKSAAARPNSSMKPPPQTAAAAAAAAAATTGSTESSTGGMGKGLFSMLQPTTTTKAPSSGQPQHSQPLNAKVAQSMASKLSDAELAAIITMTDKLSKLEKEGHMLRNEKEVLAAKLDGTEGVKRFLIEKVRDIEVKLQRSREDEIKVTQQIASDQEVIAFLDSRVQELEQQTEMLTMEKTGTQAGFDDLKVSTSKKITMLSDMLKYEREKVREDESDWKATKKVLVKEVKSCRAQILALQAERDGLKEQNDMLKRAIVSTGGGGSNSMKHHGGGNGGR